MRTLVAIKSCHNYIDRIQAIRDTWAADVENRFPESNVVLRFFIGEGTKYAHLPVDTVQLDVDDSYTGLSEKVQEIYRWALNHEFDAMFVCDDDSYVQIDRLLESRSWQRGDYVGRKRGPAGGFPAPYASGFSYWVSRKAMRIVAEAPVIPDPADDRWVGNTLARAGIACTEDFRYVVVDSRRNGATCAEGPRKGNNVISACEFGPERMRAVHQQWLGVKSELQGPTQVNASLLDSVCILTKTFLRDGYLRATVAGIEKYLPECKIVIVDDGYESPEKMTWYADLRSRGHVCAWLPFDSGFGAKANEGVKHCDREFVLIGSDDFEFTAETRTHVENMVRVMRGKSGLGFVSGRVNGNPYEARWEMRGDDMIIEHHGYTGGGYHDGLEFKCCDLTVNFGLARRTLLDRVHWDEDPGIKIGGGEHSAFFLDIKRLRDAEMVGSEVAYLVGANIREHPHNRDWMHKDYGMLRSRASRPGRPYLLKRGIKRYQLFSGSIENS